MGPRTRTILVVTLTLCALAAVVPTAEAAPPDIPENSCGYFHWHNGQLLEGELPGYHYHHCY